ncbi:MAG: hypothetical protein HZC55_09705 [Verrucomicrobia bacterium]|nr:hypothetical protein [Verrucomicrobiota bacterium]
MLTAPVGAVVGGAYGAIAAHSTSDASAAAAAIAATGGRFDLHQSLIDRLTASAAAVPEAPHGRTIEFICPPNPKPEGESRSNPASAPVEFAFATSPDRSTEAQAAAEPQLQLRVLKYKLAGNRAVNPQLLLLIDIECNVYRSGERTQAGVLYARYQGQPRKYMDWAKEGGRALQEELQMASTRLAAQIVDWLRGSLPPPFTKRVTATRTIMGVQDVIVDELP